MALFFSPEGILSINVNVLVSFTVNKYILLYLTHLFTGLFKDLIVFEIIKLHRIQVC